jgi:glycosyltransferase involved in cell wall biosynthesis
MRPKLIYLVTEDWYFVSHRLPMARAARAAGFEVHVATRVAQHASEIEQEGFVLHPLSWTRGSLDPLHFAKAIGEVRRLYRRLRPDIAHHVALVPTVIGSLAALGLPFPSINAVAGLGFAFTSHGPKARAVRITLSSLLRRLLRRRKSIALVQNPDDRKTLQAIGVPAAKIALIPGSGVDTQRLQPSPEPNPPITVGFVGRLLADKGLYTLLEAHRLLQQRGCPVHLLIAGAADPANPASIPASVLAEWKQRADVTFLGHVSDIRTVWKQAHIAVLPSRREGLPLSLLEAAACGRPLVATDVPGCREVARRGVNALLVPSDDAPALADALGQVAADPKIRRHYGTASRHLAETEFSSTRIGEEIVALYRKLLVIQPEQTIGDGIIRIGDQA